MGKRMGAQIKKARLDAGLTQEKLAQKVGGATAQDISKAERGVLELETETIKKIAKVTGVSQASLLGTSTAKKTAAATAAKKTTATVKKTTTNAKKNDDSMMRLTAAEKKLVAAYRNADATRKKFALDMLEGGSMISTLMQNRGEELVSDVLGSLLGGKNK